MNSVKLIRYILIQIIGIGFLSSPKAQDITDTLFYDAAWKICEPEPATYYRIGTFRINERAYYVGPVQDFYMDGTPEMKGYYNDSGRLHGAVVFYYPNGNTRIKGNFDNGRMSGNWYYFKPDGTLRISFYCNNHWDFAPLEFRNSKGKLVVEKGTGKFTLRTRDFPEIFIAEQLEISGEVYHGRREGNWSYARVIPGIGRVPTIRSMIRTEKYVNGNFVRGIQNPGEKTRDKKLTERQYTAISIYPQKLRRLEELDRDWIFTLNRTNPNQLAEYLLEKKRPVVDLEPRNQEENFGLFVIAIREALRKKPEMESLHAHSLRGYFRFDVPILTYPIGKNDVPQFDAQIRFNISPGGRITDLTLGGKIDERSARLIRFYMERLRNVFVINSERAEPISLRLQTRRNSGWTEVRNEIVVTLEGEDRGE